MYITYKDYQDSGGELDEAAFNDALPFAEILLDHWTLNRLKSERVKADLMQLDEWPRVVSALCALVDKAQGIKAAESTLADGAAVTSFSNGVNSFSFGASANASAGVTDAENVAYHDILRMLPVSVTSACVSYNDAM